MGYYKFLHALLLAFSCFLGYREALFCLLSTCINSNKIRTQTTVIQTMSCETKSNNPTSTTHTSQKICLTYVLSVYCSQKRQQTVFIWFLNKNKRTDFDALPPLTRSRIRLIATGKFTCMTSCTTVHENVRLLYLITVLVTNGVT